MEGVAKPSTSEMKVFEIKVTEIMDVKSFWAQIGTTKLLEEFNNQMKEISIWCDANAKKSGCHKSTALLSVEDLVCVKAPEKEGTWIRAKISKIVSEELVELFYLDTGGSGYANVSTISAEVHPILYNTPQQALQCSLAGIEMLDGEEVWSSRAESRFRDIVSFPSLKVEVHKVLDGQWICLSLFAPYEGQYTSIGEILRRDGLVKYQPLGPVNLDLPVPPELMVTGIEKKFLPDHFIAGSITMNIPTSSSNAVTTTTSASITPHTAPKSDICTLQESDHVTIESTPCKDKDVPSKNESSGSSVSDGDWLDEDLLPHRSPSDSSEVVEIESPSKDSDGHKPKEQRSDTPHPHNSRKPTVTIPRNLTLAMSNASKGVKQWHGGPKGRGQGRYRCVAGRGGAAKLQDNISSVGVPSSLPPQYPVEIPRKKVAPKKRYGPIPRRTSTPQAGNYDPQDCVNPSQNEPPKEGMNRYLSPLQDGCNPTPQSGCYQAFPSFPPPLLSGNNSFRPPQRGKYQAPPPPPQSGANQTPPLSSNALHSYPGPSQSGKYDAPSQSDTNRDPSLSSNAPVSIHNYPVPSQSDKYEAPSRSSTNQAPPPSSNPSVSFQSGDYPVPSLNSNSSACPPLNVVPSQDRVPSPQLENNRGRVVETFLSPKSPPPLIGNLEERDDPQTYSEQINKMTDQEIEDEILWQKWKMKQTIDKVFKSLDTEGVNHFMEDVHRVMQGSAATKLLEFPKFKHPLEIFIGYVVEEVVFTRNSQLDLIVEAVQNLTEAYRSESYPILKDTVQKLAEQITKSVNKQEEVRKCQIFCKFLGSLFHSCLSTGSMEYRDTIFSCVKGCLEIWSKFDQLECYQSEQDNKIQIECFGSLVESIKLVSNISHCWEMIKVLLEGPVMECVISEKQPRYIRRMWFTEVNKIINLLANGYHVSGKLSCTKEEVSEERAVGDQEIHGVVERTSERALVPYSKQATGGDACPKAALPPYGVQQPLTPLLSPQGFYQLPAGPEASPGGELVTPPDCYAHVGVMLETLHISELLPKFKAAMINDSVLKSELHVLRDCLKESSIPSGAIVQILHYLECSKKLTTQSGYENSYLAGHPSHENSIGNPGGRVEGQYYPVNPVVGSTPSFNVAQQPRQLANIYKGFVMPPSSTPPPPPEGVYYPGSSNLASPVVVDTSYQVISPSSVPHQQILSQSIAAPSVKQHVQQQNFLSQSIAAPSVKQHVQQQNFKSLPVRQQQNFKSLPVQQQQNFKSPSIQQQTLKSPSLQQQNFKSVESVMHHQSNESPVTRQNILLTAPVPSANLTPNTKSDLEFPVLMRESSLHKENEAPPSQRTPVECGFGKINCVICGGRDHVTSDCNQRSKFFTHMGEGDSPF